VLGLGVAAYLATRSMGSMAAYGASIAAARPALPTHPAPRDLIGHAILAASGHNTQPWLFQASAQQIAILPDRARRTPVVDPDDHHLFVSLGCAVENLSIAAAARAMPGRISFDAMQGGRVVFQFENAPPGPAGLSEAIRLRQSTRAEYDGRPLPTEEMHALAEAGGVEGVDLVLLTARPEIERVRDLVVTGNTAQMADPAFLRELKSWLRFNPRQAMARGDGLFSAASGQLTVPAWLGGLLFDTLVSAESENDVYARQLRSSSGVAIFVARREDPEHWVRVGRACQRFALRATALGLKTAYINQPVEVPALRSALASLAGLPGRRPDILIRFGHGPTLPYAPRRPLGEVITA